MTKILKQELLNNEVKRAMERAYKELGYMADNGIYPKPKKLRSCAAWVLETPSYYVLRSYETYVAVIEKDTDTLFDALRIVYGYTATSAQHISKFAHDYGAGKWGVTEKIVGR